MHPWVYMCSVVGGERGDSICTGVQRGDDLGVADPGCQAGPLLFQAASMGRGVIFWVSRCPPALVISKRLGGNL